MKFPKKEKFIKIRNIYGLSSKFSTYREMKPFLWFGFKVTVSRNPTTKWFKYSYEITPYTEKAKRLCASNAIPAIVYDVTSHRTKQQCIENAKENVAEILSPLWGTHYRDNILNE